MSNVPSRITDMIRRFDEECGSKGHSFADSPLQKGWLYCQGCGVTKEKESK
jgi:hypothetical protein